MATAKKMTRKQQKAATRELLKRVALDCFVKYGYQNAQIGQITQAAGVAKGTFYVHFHDKDALMDELLVEFNERFVARLMPAWGNRQGTTLVELVATVAEIFLEHWDQNSGFIQAFAQKASSGLATHDMRDGINPQMLDVLLGGFAGVGIQAGAPFPHPELVAQGILSMWLRLGMQYLFNNKVDKSTAIEVLVSMTIGAVRGVFPQLNEQIEF